MPYKITGPYESGQRHLKKDAQEWLSGKRKDMGDWFHKGRVIKRGKSYYGQYYIRKLLK